MDNRRGGEMSAACRVMFSSARSLLTSRIHQNYGKGEKEMRFIIRFIAAVSMVLLPSLSSGALWNIDAEHSNIQFKVRHLMVSNVKGVFGKVQGVITIDDKDITRSSANVSIDTASINTGVAKRDDHLRSADFFDVSKYPTMTYTSKKVVTMGAGKLKMVGDLTIHGITREAAFDVEGPSQEIKDPQGKMRRGASATTMINRKDFGLTWNKALETGGVVVGDEVTITIEVEMIKE
jgi:polyisoprenoid-binding protein YceI